MRSWVNPSKSEARRLVRLFPSKFLLREKYKNQISFLLFSLELKGRSICVSMRAIGGKERNKENEEEAF